MESRPSRVDPSDSRCSPRHHQAHNTSCTSCHCYLLSSSPRVLLDLLTSGPFLLMSHSCAQENSQPVNLIVPTQDSAFSGLLGRRCDGCQGGGLPHSQPRGSRDLAAAIQAVELHPRAGVLG